MIKFLKNKIILKKKIKLVNLWKKCNGLRHASCYLGYLFINLNGGLVYSIKINRLLYKNYI